MDPAAAGTFGFAVFKGAAIVFAMMIMAYPVYRVISLWLDRTLTASEAILYLTGLLFLFFGIIVGWGTGLGWLLMAALMLGCLGLPIINQLADRLALRRMEDEDIRHFAEALRRQPRNTYLHERLARIFLKRRQYEFAYAHAKEAVNIAPTDPGLKRLLERVETELRREQEHLRLCPKCYVENPDTAVVCHQCGFAFTDPGDLLRVLWSRPGLEAAKWSGITMLAAGLLLLALGVSVVLSGTLMMFGAAGLFWYLYAHFSRMM